MKSNVSKRMFLNKNINKDKIIKRKRDQEQVLSSNKHIDPLRE